MRILIATLILLALPLPALAGMRVIGNTLGEECYEDTLLAPNPRRNEDALAVCDRAVVDTSVNAWNQAANHVNRAEIRLRMMNFQGALDDADTALKIHDGIGVAYLNRGAGLVGLGRYAEALPDLEKALALGGGPAATGLFRPRHRAGKIWATSRGPISTTGRPPSSIPGWRSPAPSFRDSRCADFGLACMTVPPP